MKVRVIAVFAAVAVLASVCGCAAKKAPEPVVEPGPIVETVHQKAEVK